MRDLLNTDAMFDHNWDQQLLWDADTAARYDTFDEDMFAPDVLGPTVDTLGDLAGAGPALEFAIGTGRVAIPLHERGVPVTGIELSTAMIARLREKVAADEIPVLEGSMVDTRAPGEFALVYLVFNTIGNVLTQDEQVDVFCNAARHLSPGGRFVIENMVPTLRTMPPTTRGTLFHAEDGYLGVDIIDPVRQLLVSHHVRFDEDAVAQGAHEAHLARTPQRYVWPAELDLMGRIAGLELEHRWANWDRAEFNAESTPHVSVYRKVS